MSSEIRNLLIDSAKETDSKRYDVARYKLSEPLVVGKTYTLSAYVDEISRSGSDKPVLAVYDGAAWWSPGNLSGDVPGVQTITFTYRQPFEGHVDASVIALFNTPPGGDYSSVKRSARFRDVMLVEGTEPAAWAPAEGESLAGGGALMSANLLNGITPTLMYGTTESDGVWHNAGRTSTDGHVDWLVWDLVGQSALATNQTYHVGLSVIGASANSASLHATIGYKDAAGNVNWADSGPLPIGTSWGRAEATIVVPSGMTPFAIYVAAYGTCPETWMASPTLSYGAAPIVLASAEHIHVVPYVPELYTYEAETPQRVELTYTDEAFHDVGVLVPSSGDFAWGTDENDFSIDVYGTDLPPRGGLLYAEGSDVGGVVRGFESETDNDLFSVVGDTWTGVLERHVIGPPGGSDYLTISGEARDCVAQVVALTGLTSLYVVDETRTGVSFTHTFTGSRDEAESDAGRYMGAWSAIWQMMLDHGLSVTFAWDGTAKKVRMVVGRRADRTSDEEQQAGVSKLGITQKDVTNHLICLGQGTLRARTRVDLYIDAKGNVSKTQTFKGLDEMADVYDDSAAEDASKLEEDGRKKFAEIWKDHEQITDTASKGLTLSLGDLVGGTDERSGISATAVISKRVLSFSDGVPSYTYTTTVRSKR